MSAPMLPKLHPKHISVVPIAKTSFCIAIQRGSQGDKAITAFLEAQQSVSDMGQKQLIDLPQFSAAGCGSIAVRDCAFVVFIKAGDDDGTKPNSTELELLKFINEHGRKVPRP
jgi:hypothetical protein